MKREITGSILYYLDLLLPPLIRNSFIFKKIFKNENFKSEIISQDISQIKKYYKPSNNMGISLERETDLTKKALNLIISEISNSDYKKICDLGGGNLFLKNEIKKELGIDIDVLDFNYSNIEYGLTEYNLEEKLDFIEDNYYEFSISTHTIEHLLNSKQFLNEMKRITKNEIILVFPKQMPYLYTPDTHINFFPYKFEVEKLFGKIDGKKKKLIDLKYDWIYLEKISS
tara:strand:- start:24 stop:707 length:684 start_codon:yes stop_codon:yes gene_type:complete